MVRAIICGVVVLLVATLARAQAEVADLTGGDLLSLCASTDPTVRHEKCDRVLGPLFQGAVMSAMSHSDNGQRLCLKATNDVIETFKMYEAAVLQWLRDHPDAQSLPVIEAVIRATEDLYKCK